MSPRLFLSTVILMFEAVPSVNAGHTLTTRQAEIVQSWLSRHPPYRLAIPQDCAAKGAIESYKQMSIGLGHPVPDYNPYQAVGDFNSDGIIDVAVAVVKRSRVQNGWALLVFNGPFDSPRKDPAFIQEELDLQMQGLSFTESGPAPHWLYLGEFEAEGVNLVPKGKSYILKGPWAK